MLDNWLRHSVNVQRPTPTQGNNFGEVDTWTTVYASLACFIQPISSQWRITYAQRSIEVTHTIGTNRNPTVREGDRILYGSRTFQVKGIRNIQESGKQLLLDCLELIS